MNCVASSAGVGAVSSDARLVTDVGMEERRCRRKRKARVVVMAVVAVADMGWRSAVEGQLEPRSCPACRGRPWLDWFGVDRYRFGLGRSHCLERRRPALGSGRNMNQEYGVSEVRGWATSP